MPHIKNSMSTGIAVINWNHIDQYTFCVIYANSCIFYPDIDIKFRNRKAKQPNPCSSCQ